MHSRVIWVAAGVLIAALLGSLGLTWAHSGQPLSFVVDSCIDRGKTYVIDDNGRRISILETDGAGRITGAVRLPKQKEGAYAVLDYLNVDQGGVYVYKRECAVISNEILSENVYRCNFARGRLELAWELPVEGGDATPTEQTVYAVKVKEGTLSCFGVDYAADEFAARAVLYTAAPESKPRKRAAVDYDIGIGFTDFYYADNGAIAFSTPNGEVFQAVAPDGKPAVSGPAAEKGDTGEAAAQALPAAAPAVETAAPANRPEEEFGREPDMGVPATATEEADEFGREPDAGVPAADEFGREPDPGTEMVATSPAGEEFGREAELVTVPGGEAAAEPPVETMLPAAPASVSGSLPVQEPPDVAAVLAQGLAPETAEAPPPDKGFRVLEAQRIFPAPGADMDSLLTNFSGHENLIYYMDLYRDGIYSFDLETGRERVVLDDLSALTLDGAFIQPYDLKKIRFADPAHFTAAVGTAGGAHILGVFTDGAGLSAQQFTLPRGQQILRAVLYFLAIILGFLLLYVARETFLLLTKGKVPIISKLIAAFIPVVVVGILLLQSYTNTTFVNMLVDKQYKELFLISRQQVDFISPQLLSEIDLENPYDNVYYFTLRSVLNALPAHSTLYNDAGEEGQQVHNFSYNWLLKVEDGRLHSMYCDQNYINVPIEYYYDRATTALYNRAMETKQTVRGDFRDMGGNWIVLAIPLLDEDGEVYALMETGVTKAPLEYMVAESSKRLSIVNLGVLSVLILLLTGILLRSLAPLKKLKDSVQAITGGRLGVQTPVRGNDEVAEIGRVFNQMSTSIEFHVNELTDLNEGYYKFVPSKMFRLLRKSSVIDVRLGDQTRQDITIFSFDAVQFEEIISTMTGEEMFNLINRIFSSLVPIVNSNGGVVDKFENAGLVAFYTGGSEQALVTAISVCQTMNRLNAEQDFGPDRQIEIAGGISHGPVMIGIVGHAERLAATTISEHTNLSRYLRRLAPRYGARILTTAAAIARIEDFDTRFNARFIGFLKVRASDSLEKLYEVFDGDTEERKHLKKLTKDLFERGVDLYCQKEFYEARLVFIEVLKQFRQDAAAKEYLYRCDKYYQMENTDAVDVFIESY